MENNNEYVEVLIICFNAYGFPHEREFDANVRFRKIHSVLSEVCESYIITQSYFIHKKVEYKETDINKILKK